MEEQKIYAVVDCRVSDEQQLKGGSLELQEMAARDLAKGKSWDIDKVFKKPHSATTSEREDILEIIAYVKMRRKEGVDITKYICKSIDRLTRMGSTEYWYLKELLEEAGLELVDTTGIIQPKKNTLSHLGDYAYEWSVYSPSRSAEMIEAENAKGEFRTILTRMVGAEIQLVQDGYAVRQPPDGLRNKHVFISDTKKKVVREPDPERAPYFQKMFELLAEGMDYPSVCDHLNAMGFRTRMRNAWDRSIKDNPRKVGKKGGVLLTVKQLQRYVTQTEYAGINYEKWTKHRPVKMQGFEGIVSIDVFNRANRGAIFIKVYSEGDVEILHNYSPWGRVKHLRDNPKYPWKVILCPFCKSEMTASASTGKLGKKFDAYHCGGLAKNPKRNHKYFRVPVDEFHKNIFAYLSSLRFEDGFMAGLELHLLDEFRNREKEILGNSSAISRTISDLKAELAQKLESFDRAETPTMRRMIERRVVDLEEQIVKAEERRGKIEITERSIRGFRHYAEQLLEHPAELLTGAENTLARKALMSLFFEETPTYQEILNGTPKLQPLFRLSEDFKANKTQLVTPRGFEPRFTP